GARCALVRLLRCAGAAALLRGHPHLPGGRATASPFCRAVRTDVRSAFLPFRRTEIAGGSRTPEHTRAHEGAPHAREGRPQHERTAIRRSPSRRFWQARSIPTGTRVQTLSTLTADPSTHAGLTGQAQAALTARSCRAVPATQAAVAASSCVLSAVCCPPCGITG